MSEDERIEGFSVSCARFETFLIFLVAIRLTLCELATARHHTPPLECSPFSNNVGSHIPHHAVGDCVDALSRSAQFWSSYSGYLREIPQLCFAFRRWMEIDTAKDIYRNITMEKLALIRFFLEQQRGFTAAHQNWERSSTDLRDLISVLKSTSGNIRDVADVTSTSIIQNAQSLLKKPLQLFTKMETTLSLINQRSFDDHIHSLDKVDRRIDDLTLSHSKSLSSLLSLVESRLTAEIEAIASLMSEQSLESRAVADQVQQKWSALDATFFAMQNSFYDMQSVITGLVFSLETSLSQVLHVQEIQREVAESVSLLDNRISQLTEVTHRELETINQTALALIDTFQRKSKHEAWLINLQWLLRFVEPTSLLGLKTFQAVTSLLVFLWRLLEVALSLLMTSVAVSSIRSQLSFKFRGSKQVQPQESSWRLDSHLETNVSPVSNVRHLQRNDCLDPRIIRRLTGPRISRIPDRICRRTDPY
ncbi:uncharacterized protein F5147DRAFT_814675 [Suillus discolor]|uniref:Nuclear fusion protein KAR5 n=1 Tax=Suillus discolor TaxID=1912936 RepID=A0A9P7JQK7_9AGAM|nr:uncharacterized protein F5147DRAFT_814675 [Suillus discolor]KAG2098988.1 hypothetical protein F5147DRAFT_814675 [Suillus discolor]